MPKKILLLDMDGPIVDFERKLYRVWSETYPDLLLKPLSERQYWDIVEDHPEHKERLDKIICCNNFALDLEPTEGVMDALDYLTPRFEIYICTAPLMRSETNFQDKFEWVRKHLGEYFQRRICLIKSKKLVFGHYLIDDKPEIDGDHDVPELPFWEHILFDTSFNKSVQGKRRLNWSNYKEVLDI